MCIRDKARTARRIRPVAGFGDPGVCSRESAIGFPAVPGLGGAATTGIVGHGCCVADWDGDRADSWLVSGAYFQSFA